MSSSSRKSHLLLYAKTLKFLILYLAIPFITGRFLYGWIRYGTTQFNRIKIDAMQTMGLKLYGIKLIPNVHLKLLAIAVDSISIFLFILGCIYFAKLLNLYMKGEFFSKKSTLFYRAIVKIAFAWTFYNPVKLSLLSIITTFDNPPGQRILTLTIKDQDIFHIFILGSFLVINSLMQEAYKLKKEQDLTV